MEDKRTFKLRGLRPLARILLKIPEPICVLTLFEISTNPSSGSSVPLLGVGKGEEDNEGKGRTRAARARRQAGRSSMLLPSLIANVTAVSSILYSLQVPSSNGNSSGTLFEDPVGLLPDDNSTAAVTTAGAVGIHYLEGFLVCDSYYGVDLSGLRGYSVVRRMPRGQAKQAWMLWNPLAPYYLPYTWTVGEFAAFQNSV